MLKKLPKFNEKAPANFELEELFFNECTTRIIFWDARFFDAG